MARLSAARYGKDNVRVFKRDKEGDVETVTELTVCCLLEGQIDESYTVADNKPVVATDSIKNTIFIKAKELPVNPIEQFASMLGQHFLDTYPHISVANVDIIRHRWTRITVDGQPHPHSFYRDGDEKRTVSARVTREGTDISSSLKDLLVLKSTGSMFYGYVQDEFTTLKETWDRILSTSVDATWAWKTFPNLEAVKSSVALFDKAFDAARGITLKTFAEENSPSVQNTMYKMCEQILEAVPETSSVSYALPNKHYFEVDLSWHKGIKNTGADASVYAPQSGPNGLIKCEVTRD
ncbi:uricase [Xylariales sp. PMI_506]|nr:uricase [Xylariales sp. PMI_506]